MAKIMQPEPGMTIYDPYCGSAGLLIKCQLVLQQSPHFTEKSADMKSGEIVGC